MRGTEKVKEKQTGTTIQKNSDSTKSVSLLQCCFMRRKNVSLEENEYLVNGFLCVCCVSYDENTQFYAFLIYLSALN